MNKLFYINSLFLFFSFFSLYAAPLVIGLVTSSSGDCWAFDISKRKRVMKMAEEVFAGDELTTSERSLLTIKLSDASELKMAGPSSIHIIGWGHHKLSGTSSFHLECGNGTFSLMSGDALKDHPELLKIESINCSIRIHGTYLSWKNENARPDLLYPFALTGGTSAVQALSYGTKGESLVTVTPKNKKLPPIELSSAKRDNAVWIRGDAIETGNTKVSFIDAAIKECSVIK